MLFTFILFFILFSISIEDLKTMLISEIKLIILALSGLFYLITLGLSNEKLNTINLIVNNFISMIIIFTIMYLLSYISFKIFEIHSLGMGDIKLSSISTFWLGIELSFLSLCISFLLSAIYSLHGKITKKNLSHFNSIHLHHFYQLGYFVHGL